MYQCAPPGGSESGPREEADEALLRIEQFEERHEVELVGSPAVREDECARRLAQAGRTRWTIGLRSGAIGPA